jgi:phospholipase C
MIKYFAAFALALALAGCGQGNGVAPSGATAQSVILSEAPQARNRSGATTTPIKHVVFIIQENRSFNNLFMGFPGATTQNYGYDTSGNKISLQSVDLSTQWDIDHSAAAFIAACDGTGSLPGTNCKMDGWNNEKATLHAPANAPYSYVAQSEIQPYWTLAKQYVLSDETFASNLDASFVAHQYAVAGYADRTVNGPAGPWGCEGGKPDTTPILTKKRTISKNRVVTCFDFTTLADEADAAGVTWRFYAEGIYDFGGIWSSYQADDKIYNGPDWSADVISPGSQFLTDVGKDELANVTWITPTYPNSDHAGLQSNDGPAWVASLVDAVGESKFWKSTAIFILWDDWGGWFDPVAPSYKDYDGLGFRIPLIVVSPYAKKGSVTHAQYESSSVLRFIEDNFGLAPMAKSDARASDPAGDSAVFNYAQSPRKFKKVAGSKPAWYWTQLEKNSLHSRTPRTMIGDD